MKFHIGSRWSVAFSWENVADSVKSPGSHSNQEFNIQKSQRDFHGGFFVRDTLLLTRLIFLCPEICVLKASIGI
ncbi:MAG: hypothetical protein V7L22_22955 [Nostoc sp.]|uniref:hypothetical protein n=1 Tax=Nostoc sp. TaxID=1180 RepID=UPI002FF702B1